MVMAISSTYVLELELRNIKNKISNNEMGFIW